MPEDFARFKEEVKSRVDIAEVIGEYVDLRRHGSSIMGLCPFHTEKAPSFNVNREGQFYYCFGCGKGGDVISFLMDITGMSFMEAIEHLAERTGLEMPRKRGFTPESRELADRVIAANLAAAEYFHRMLNTEEGKPGSEYLLGRGLSPAVIRTFRLGYAPEDPSGLLAFAQSKSVSLDDLDFAGILIKSKYGGPPFSRFGGRVVFPIIDPAARILGFGARILAGEGAKYVNSPETPVYHKSRVLFGLHQAKAAIRKLRAAVVVEGYMDVIALHQAGFTNVLAASGTAFTLEQGRLIARQARSVTLLFDGDRAGLSAAARGADTLLATDLAISVCVLPEGHDPDSYVRTQGADALGEYLEHPMGIWEFKLLALSGETVGPEDRIRLAGEIADSISLIPDELKREVYIREMALKLDVDRNDLQKAVIGRVRRKTMRRESGAASKKLTGEIVDKTGLLAAILRYPDFARAFMQEAGSKPFTHPAMRRVAEEMFRRMVEGMDVSPTALMNALDDPQAQQVIVAASVIELDEKTAAKYIADNLRSHIISELRAEHGELSQMIGKADARKKEELQKRKDEVKAKLDSLLGKNYWKPGRE